MVLAIFEDVGLDAEQQHLKGHIVVAYNYDLDYELFELIDGVLE